MTALGVHWLDIVIVAVIGAGLIMGALSGAVRQVIRLATFVAAIYAAIYCHRPMGDAIASISGKKVPVIFAALATFAVVSILLSLAVIVIRKLWQTIRPPILDESLGGLRFADRVLGAGIGGLLATVAIAFAVIGMECISSPRLQAKMRGSALQPRIDRAVGQVLAAIPQSRKNELQEAFVRLKRTAIQKMGETGGDGAAQTARLINNLSTEVEKQDVAANDEAAKQLLLNLFNQNH